MDEVRKYSPIGDLWFLLNFQVHTLLYYAIKLFNIFPSLSCCQAVLESFCGAKLGLSVVILTSPPLVSGQNSSVRAVSCRHPRLMMWIVLNDAALLSVNNARFAGAFTWSLSPSGVSSKQEKANCSRSLVSNLEID